MLMTGGLLTGFEIWLICYIEGASEGFYPHVIESIDSDVFGKTNLIQGLCISWAMCGYVAVSLDELCLLLIQTVINLLGLPLPGSR